ncbi:MAG: hypothetical protein O2931_01110 [Planctomycetota bacterium]|nr:hypothetical protein [Planctomycetota bacterium]
MSVESSTLRKISVLLECLDESTRECVIASLATEEFEGIRQAALYAGPISPAERQEVLREFMDVEQNARADRVSGIEIEASLAELLAESNVAGQTRGVNTAEDNSNFEFLSRLNAKQLARRLERESPQVAAVVLSQVPPAKASEILHAMSPERQQLVVQRLVVLDDQDPMVLDAIRLVLEREFPEQISPNRKVQSPGWKTTRAIVQASSPPLRRELNQLLADLQLLPSSVDLSTNDHENATASSSPAREWTPPWLQLFAEQENPWYFKRS